MLPITHGDRSREFLGILQSALHIFVAVADDDAGSSGCGGSAVEAVGLIISGFWIWQWVSHRRISHAAAPVSCSGRHRSL